MGSQSPVPSDTVKVEDSTDAIDNEATITPAPATAATTSSSALSKETYEMMNGIVKQISEHKDEDHLVATMFQRMVQKRLLPDYYEVIKEPIAFSTIRAKLLKKTYPSFKDFVRDVALISHNAQVYNRPSAPVYNDAITLRDLFKVELQNLVDQKKITAEEAELPDLGEIPEVEDSPAPAPGEEDEDDEDDEDDEEEEEESDEDAPKRRGRRRGGRSSAPAKREGKVEDAKDEIGPQKTRGRPPKVETAMEKRISALLRGLRKLKNPRGDLKILAFEKLPDKTVMPDYYQETKNPIAMDLIKKKAKRKKYQSVDHALKDLELMFENAKAYNREDSAVYKDAVDLQREARTLADQEKQKPDIDFADEDGRLPLSEIQFKGEMYKVGDWVHLRNDNDISKPIPAQIYRTWRDAEGLDCINACWYFRPEQTVHRFEKHFLENEVVKTGRYEDHKIDDVVDRCFVMFFTRFYKGRPRGFPANKEVYVCEARYNEVQFKLNKIKTWASCVPDEVRDKDYEMDLFEIPRKMKKVESPIKHLLKSDAKETDPLPQPTWGTARGPPLIGNVHCRAREPNESPPPEPTPSPTPVPEAASPVRRSQITDRPGYDSQGDVNMSGTYPNTHPSPMAKQNSTPMPHSQHHPAPRPSASPAPMLHHASYGSHGSGHAAMPQATHYQSQSAFNPYASTSSAPTPTQQQSNTQVNAHYQNALYQNSTPRPQVTTTSHSAHISGVNTPRQSEVWSLDAVANSNIPKDIRHQFQCDEHGKIVFFTAPPLDIDPVPEQKQALGHSLRYLADKARHEDKEKRKRAAREAELEVQATAKAKRFKAGLAAEREQVQARIACGILQWVDDMNKGTDEIYRRMHGDDWMNARKADIENLVVKQARAYEQAKELEEFRKEREKAKKVKITGFRL